MYALLKVLSLNKWFYNIKYKIIKSSFCLIVYFPQINQGYLYQYLVY